MKTLFHIFMITAAAAFMGFNPAHAATVKGKISGKSGGAPAKINVTKDQSVCGKKPLFKEALIVSKSGGLKNAVIEIVGTDAAKPGQGVIAQDGCKFSPHVVTVTAESAIKVENKDGITHNFHTFGFENDPVNFSQPGDMKTKVVKEGFEMPEVIKLQCDIHEWMNAWIVVTEGASVGISGDDGSFTIPNVKPGSYKVKVWHEKLGEVVKDITVKDGDNVFNLALGK